MKPGLAILPLEVWADVSEHPLITRELLAQIADNNGDRNFTAKLQKLLHDCGKQTLHYMNIFLNKCGEPQNRPCLKVAHCRRDPEKDCEFPPETPMPENITGFKQLAIGHLEDDVLDFLHKIRPLFTNVVLQELRPKDADVRTALAHLLPMLGGIRAIETYTEHIHPLEQHFPGTVAHAEELHLRSTGRKYRDSIAALIDIILTTYNMVISRDEDRKFFKKFSLNYLTYDEGQMLRNYSTDRQNNLVALIPLLYFTMRQLFDITVKTLPPCFKCRDQRQSAEGPKASAKRPEREAPGTRRKKNKCK